MRFYLTYKDHGFYDPVVDDTEVIYIPVDPEQLEVVNVQRNIPERQPKLEIVDFNQTGEASKFVPHTEEFLTDPDIEELPLLINVDEIPPGFKFRLPISEAYDPEGNRVKLDKSKKEAEVTFKVKKILDETNEERIRLQQKAQDAVTEYISESKIYQNQEIKEDYIKTDEETDLNVIIDKALEVVNETIDKSVSVAKQKNENVTEIKTSEDQTEIITKELSKGFEENVENVEIRKGSIKKIEYDVNVSEEIQKFEKIDTQTTESIIEERKLLAQQEIDETIQSGTVRQTSDIFSKENIEVSKPYRIEINQNNNDSIYTEKDESSLRDSSAKQRAFSIGLKTIPHIRENINPLQIDYRLNLLTTFFLQLTNIMVTLSRFIAIEPKIYSTQDSYIQSQDKRGFEKKKEKSKFDKGREQTFEGFEQHEEGQGLSKYKYEHVSDDSGGEMIRKGKLSGAKIAQIEGRKTIELTDKMDTVISEFHKKSGIEEQLHDQFFRSHSGSRSKMKSEENTFYGESQKQSHTDHRKTYKEFAETKTQSLDISEMKSEKHSFESNTTKTEAKPYAYETTSTDGKNLTYVAIVEAHVYTNKDAIFEEQMKRKREMKTQNIEQTKIETNQETTIEKLSLVDTIIIPATEQTQIETNQETTIEKLSLADTIIIPATEQTQIIETNQETTIEKLSLADTIIIPATEEISVSELKDNVNIIERAATGIEQSTIKIAAKKISEVLEPLVELTSDRLHSVDQIHRIKEGHVSGLSQKIYPSLEKPTKSVVEITEIIAEENKSQDLDVLKLIVAKPKSIIEDAKPIAETIEICIKEDSLAVLDESKPHEQKPRQIVESMVKSVAETTEVVTGSNIDMLITPEVLVKTSRTAIEDAFKATAETLTILPEESKSDFVETTKIKQESAKVLIGEKVSSEVFEVSLIEQREESLDEKKIKIEQPILLLEESTFSVAQKSYISPVEPKSDIEIFTKVEKTAKMKFDELKAVESTITDVEEPGTNILETPEIIQKYPLSSMEDPHLRIAQVYTILPDEPKDELFEVSKITECKSSIDIVDIKAAETIITRTEEPKYEQLDDLKIEKKSPETSFEGPSLKVAETISMSSEEPKAEFYIPQFKNQQAEITMVEFKTAETTIVEAEESKQPKLNIEQPKEKRSKQIIEPSNLSVAIKTTEIVKRDEPSRSITPTSPTTPVVEEYMFAVEAELDHPYVVEEAVSEEASLRIKTQKKEIQNADTSFTLAIESIIEADSKTIEKIEEIEDIHLSNEVHESTFEGYNAKTSHMSFNVESKVLDANQLMSTEAYSSHSHHKVSGKNQTTMQNAINISALETNRNVSTAAVKLESESMSNQSRNASQSSLNKSIKVKSNKSQYSRDQELQSSVTSMQSKSVGSEIKAESSQYSEDSNKQLSISKSMESTVIEGNIGLEAHQHIFKASGSYGESVSKSVKSKSSGSIESVTQFSTQVTKGKSNAYIIDEKLTLQTDLKNTISNDGQSSTPQSVPPTPLTDEYIFTLQTKMPKEAPFIPRDCSISPESIHEDVIVNGLLTNYKTKIDDRILYNPPLPTPPTSPEKAKPVYTKPGLKGGSERQDLTKEEIYDSTLVSAIDRTLKQIEEYKASVGLTTEEMSFQQEDLDKELTPVQRVEEWMDNEAVQDKTKNSEVEEIDAIKITVVTEDNNAGETAVTVTTEGNVDDDGDDLEIQEISSNFDEISLEIEHDKVLGEQNSRENKVEDFIPIQIKSDENLEDHEEDYEWVAVHPSSLNRIGADDERETKNQLESEVLNANAQETQTTDLSKNTVIQHDQEIIGGEAIIPPVESLKDSEVIKLLNEERTAVEERKWTTFLQKKYSPAPKMEVVYYGDFDIKTQIIPDTYKVKIVKQPKPKIAPDWKAIELKKESSPIIEISEPQATEGTEKEDQDIIEQDNELTKEENIIEEDNILVEQEERNIEDDTETDKVKEVIDKETEELDLEEMAQRNLAEELIQNVENMIDINAPTDQQLEQMRDQLAALAQLPSVIQRTVELVHKRINLISQKEQQKKEEEEEYRRQEEEHRRQEEEHRRQEEEKREELERTKHSLELRVRKTEEELAILMEVEGKRRMIREAQQKKEKVELMKIDQESRQVTQRSNPRVGKPVSLFGPTIQERPVILPGGRKWRTPEDVYDDEFITESLVGQAEVIKGTAIGVNFMKFDKPPPALDHLKHSEVFKAIHDIEQPIKKVELLGPVLSEADYKEKARSMSPCVEKVAEFTSKQSS